MITLATLRDEMVEGQRRAAGKQIRRLVIICLDNYNLVIAEGSDPANPQGKHFFGNLTHLAIGLTADYAELVEIARKGILDFFEKYSGETVGDLSWAEMDKRFEVGKRTKDSSGKLKLYPDLRERGWSDGAETSQTASEEA